MLMTGVGLLISQTTWAAQAIQNSQEYIDKDLSVKNSERVITSFSETSSDTHSDVKFYLKKLIVNGVFKDSNISEELQAVTKKYDGKEVSIKDLNTAVAEITTYFRRNGYPAATAYLPQQASKDGSVQINVEVGRYGNIIIENESCLNTKVIERLSSVLQKGDVIRGRKLETVLHNIIDLGGVRAGGVMRPGSALGETDVVIRVENGKRDSYVLYSENHGSKSSGRYRYGVVANWYEMAGVGDHLAMNGSVSNEEQHNYGIQYDQLVGKDGTKLGIGVSRTDYELGSHYSALGAVGEATTVGINGSTPLWKTSTSRMSLNYGWDYRKLQDELREFDYLIEKHSNAFYLGINGMERIDKTNFNYDLTLYAGRLSYDDAYVGGIPLPVENDGKYSKALLNVSAVHQFDRNIDLLVKAQVQQAGNNLDSSEQIYLGGANAVRAYPQGEASGDEGYQATAELRYHTKVYGLTLSTFFDIGHVKYTQNGSIPGGTTLKGWGIGVSYSESHGYWARVDYARRIGLAKDATDDAKDKDRIWFVVGKSW